MVRPCSGYRRYQRMQQKIRRYICLNLKQSRKNVQNMKKHQNRQCAVNATLQWNCNKAPGEESPRSRSMASDPPGSDYSRNTLGAEATVPDQVSAPYTAVPEVASQNQADMPRLGPSANDQGSSRVSVRDDESYLVPNRSSVSAPRMIQAVGVGQGFNENAFKRLRKMGSSSEPTGKLQGLPPPGDLGAGGYPEYKETSSRGDAGYQKSREYHSVKCFCVWSTTLMIILAIATIATIVIAISEVTDKCTNVSICLLATNLFVLIILIVEWIRTWLWREPDSLGTRTRFRGDHYVQNTEPSQATGTLPPITMAPEIMMSNGKNDNSNGGLLTPGLPQRLYDVPQFISAICLILLYLVTLICVCATLSTACRLIEDCVVLANCAVGYSAVILTLILLRTILCCLSEACQGVIYRTAKATSGPDGAPVPIMAVNQLHGVLPGLGKSLGSERTGPPAPWLAKLTSTNDPSQSLSIVQPMPSRYANHIA